MSLLDQIKTDLNEARKEKNTPVANLLSTLYAETLMIGKNDGDRDTTEEESVAKIKAFIKNINETLKTIPEGNEKRAEYENEKTILEKYLPTQISVEELTKIIEGIAENHEKSMKSMGKVMGELKGKYAGQFDGKLASVLVKKILAG
jgi:uncharacterized protein YqeY